MFNRAPHDQIASNQSLKSFGGEVNINATVLTALLVMASSAACAATPAAASHAAAPATSSQTPPTDKYNLVATQNDPKGKYQLYFHFVTGQDQVGNSPIVWVKVVRFKSDADKKSGYPAEYFLFNVDCGSNSYAVSAKFEYDADGHDLNPESHYSKNPLRTQIPGSKSRVYVKPGMSPPEMWAASLMDQECTAGA